MALITLPTTITRDELQEYRLNSVELVALVDEEYFEDQNNWKKVILLYQSTVSNQIFTVVFQGSASPELITDGLLSEAARDNFNLAGVGIVDFQEGRYFIPRSEIPSVVSYDISIGGGGGYTSLPASFEVVYAANVLSPEDIEGALLNPGLYGFDIDWTVSKATLTDEEQFNSNAGVVYNTSGGSNNGPMATLMQSDGKLIIGGNIPYIPGSNVTTMLARLNSDGSNDTAFNNNFTLPSSQYVYKIVNFSSSVFMFAGIVSNFSGFTWGADGVQTGIAFINTDGTINTDLCNTFKESLKSFNAGGSLYIITDLLIQPDGKILVSGRMSTLNGVSGRNALTRLNSDGTPDTAFLANAVNGSSFGTTSYVSSVSLQSDGKILVGGTFLNYKGVSGRNKLIRLNSDGTLDTDFCAAISDSARFGTSTSASQGITSIHVSEDQKIFVTGGFPGDSTLNIGQGFLVINPDNTIDVTLSRAIAGTFAAPNFPELSGTRGCLGAGVFKGYIWVMGRKNSPDSNTTSLFNMDGTPASGLGIDFLPNVNGPALSGLVINSFKPVPSSTSLGLSGAYIASNDQQYVAVAVVVNENAVVGSGQISYLGVNGLPSTELGSTGVSLSTTPTGQLQYTNDSTEGELDLNISLKTP